MGGLMIVRGAVVGYIVAHFRASDLSSRHRHLRDGADHRRRRSSGSLDDWIKVTRERNLGLNKRTKIGGLLVVAVGFAVLIAALHRRPHHAVVHAVRLARRRARQRRLGGVGVLLILGTTNAVNLTDGLDGLAPGSAIFAFIAFVVIGFWAFRHHLDVYRVAPRARPRGRRRRDARRHASASCGGTRRRPGSSWATPARSPSAPGSPRWRSPCNTQLLLPIIGGLFVIETLSVIVQVGSFRLFERRVFRMAPIHHHFELGGWPETTVIIRFWILAGLCTALAPRHLLRRLHLASGRSD